MATVHDQEDERRGFDYDSRGNEEAVTGATALVVLKGTASQLSDINVVMIVTITFRSGWQDGIMSTKPLQIHDLVSTTAATGVFKRSPGEGATDDYLEG